MIKSYLYCSIMGILVQPRGEIHRVPIRLRELVVLTGRRRHKRVLGIKWKRNSISSSRTAGLANTTRMRGQASFFGSGWLLSGLLLRYASQKLFAALLFGDLSDMVDTICSPVEALDSSVLQLSLCKKFSEIMDTNHHQEKVVLTVCVL